MNRRDFIKCGMVSLGALSLKSLTGCASSGGGDGYIGVEIGLLRTCTRQIPP